MEYYRLTGYPSPYRTCIPNGLFIGCLHLHLLEP
jgi:hypothetical protein